MNPMLIGGIAGGVGVLLFGLLAPAKTCPQCTAALPRFRKATNKRQRMWGGWTCKACGCEIDRKGKKVEAT